jgi:dihydroorotate dehydrogenase electron transfer subunit
MQAEGIIRELILLDGKPSARIQCDPSLIPAPGQYLLAYADGSDSPLADSVFSAKSFADGFLAAPPSWAIGVHLHLRGPLGHGFILPNSARRVALIAFYESPIRLLALLDSVLTQEASIVLVCQTPPDDLPLQIEVQPMSALLDICDWADAIAIDAARESMPELKKMLGAGSPLKTRKDAQVLIRTPMPCGAIAKCGVCAIESHRGHLLACKDGPVFDLKDFVD